MKGSQIVRPLPKLPLLMNYIQVAMFHALNKEKSENKKLHLSYCLLKSTIATLEKNVKYVQSH